MRNTDDKPIEDAEPPANPPEGAPAPDGKRSGEGTPFDPADSDPPKRPYSAGAPSGFHDSAESGEPLPTPQDAFWGNLTDPFNNTTIAHRAKNAFTYGEMLGRTLHGWRIKALSLLFRPNNATTIEIVATRGVIKGFGKGLVFVAPLSVLVDLVDVLRKNRFGSSGFCQNYGMAGLGAVGGVLGGTVFEAFGFGFLASLGLTGVGLFVAAPVIFGLVGAGLLQFAGSVLNQETRQGSAFYSWFPGSFLDRCVSVVFSWFSALTDGSVPVAQGGEQTAQRKYPPVNSTGGNSSNRLYDPDSTGRRRRLQTGLLLPPERKGPDGAAGIDEGGENGRNGGQMERQNAAVGGILFDNCHAVLSGIEEITGAFWDASARSLVLIGTESAGAAERRIQLPAMDADHLKVALRAAIVGESLGISIDAPAAYRYGEISQRMPPTGTPFPVSYLGGCERTLTGAIFFEADRIMKCLSMGLHNETRKPFQAHVPGFRSTFDLRGESGVLEGSSWHRFWFVVDHVELKRTTGSDAVTFGDVKIAIKTELERQGASPGQFSDAQDAQFAQHLTSHYDAYAGEFPVLARLKELAKISALAQFLIDEGVDLDLGELLDNLPVDISTPEATPSLIRSETSCRVGCARTFVMSGGVDLRARPSYQEDVAGVASHLRERALAGRAPESLEWAFRLDTASLRASTIKVGATRRLRYLETDHEFPLAEGLPRLRLQRNYESKGSENGMFGPDWNALIPWSLTLMPGSGKRPEALDPKSNSNCRPQPILALRYRKSGNVQIYRPLPDVQVNGRPVWGRLTSKKGASNPSDVIYERNGGFVMERNARKRYFDGTGRLVEVSCEAGTSAKYLWVGGRLERVENQAGQWYVFVYSAESKRVEKVQASDGQTIRYSYGPDSCLCEVNIGDRREFAYRYDFARRLNEVSDASGGVVRRFFYGAIGEPLNGAGSDELHLSGDQTVVRSFSDGRLTSLSTKTGDRAEFTYGPKGHLQSTFVSGRDGLKYRFEYGVSSKLRRIVDPMGRTTEIEYDEQGEAERVTLSSGTVLAAKRNVQNKTVEVTASGDQGCRAVYDSGGMLKALSGSAIPSVELQRSLSGVASIKISGEWPTPIGDGTRAWDTYGHLRPTRFEFGQRTSRRFTGRHRVKHTLSSSGRSLRIDGPIGTLEVSTAEDGRTECVAFV